METPTLCFSVTKSWKCPSQKMCGNRYGSCLESSDTTIVFNQILVLTLTLVMFCFILFFDIIPRCISQIRNKRARIMQVATPNQYPATSNTIETLNTQELNRNRRASQQQVNIEMV